MNLAVCPGEYTAIFLVVQPSLDKQLPQGIDGRDPGLLDREGVK